MQRNAFSRSYSVHSGRTSPVIHLPPTPPLPPPTSTQNHRKLSGFYFSEYDLTAEQKKVYETYCCAINQEIMSEPVYFKQQPNRHYEHSWILYELEQRELDPYTREPRAVSDLILDKTLQTKINRFIEYIMYAISKKELTCLLTNQSFFNTQAIKSNQKKSAQIQQEFDMQWGLTPYQG